MKRNIRHLLFLLVVFAFFVLIPTAFLHAETVDAPTIISVEQMGGQYLNRPLVKGLTPADTQVMIYIDGIYLGEAHVNEESTQTANFYFQPVEALEPGNHSVSAVAKDKISLVLSAFSNAIVFNTNHLLPPPILVEPDENTATGKVKPLIKGLSHDNTFVHVFIDGVYNGKTGILNHESGTANFAYEPFLNLAVGPHSAWAIAEDENGKKSEISNVLYFTVQKPLPAPILFQPVVNYNTTYNQPFIVGLAKNDLTINVYIDHKLNGSFKVQNHQSGTANFAYKPFLNLSEGSHLVYVSARDSQGKESKWSDLIYFNVASPLAPEISEEGVMEEYTEEPAPEESEEIDFEEIELPPEPAELPDMIEMEEEENVKEEEAAPEIEAMEELEDILKQTEPEEEETGAINESKEQQGQLKLNLIIFILFLLAIIVWIFWVNRELIKERKAQTEEEKKEKEPSDTDGKNSDDDLPKFKI